MEKNVFFLFVLLLILSCNSNNSSSLKNEISVVSYGGGAYHESHINSFIKPFEKITGINIQPVVWNAEYGLLKSLVEAGDPQWDVVEVTDAIYKRGIEENLFEKLLLKPEKKGFKDESVSNFGVANVFWGTVITFNKNVYKEYPSSWKDFWDIKNFPGNRAMRNDPRGNLEFALLADGVSIDSLYPLDIDRAFSKLNEIKPHIRVWWEDGTQPIQLILNNSIDMSSAWSGRIFALGSENKSIDYVWNESALEKDWWVIPRGSKQVDVASRFIYFASSPENLAKQAEQIGYGPVNNNAFKYVDDSIRTHLPTYDKNWKKSFVINSDWWSKNENKILKQWLKWKSES